MKLNIFLLSAAALANIANGDPEAAIDLKSAEDFVILTKKGISTVPESSITGDIGASPVAATYITGFSLSKQTGPFSTSTQVADGSVVYAADYATPTPTKLTTAISDMVDAYSEASERPNNDSTRTNPGVGDEIGEDGGEIGGMTLEPGVYTFTEDITINSDVFLFGNENDVFIIQTTGNIEQADSTMVKPATSGDNGVQASNVFWQVAGRVTVGAGAHMEGILLVKGDALFETGSSLKGRVLAQTTCDLQKASITQPAATE
jgi:hypothetical protein